MGDVGFDPREGIFMDSALCTSDDDLDRFCPETLRFFTGLVDIPSRGIVSNKE